MRVLYLVGRISFTPVWRRDRRWREKRNEMWI